MTREDIEFDINFGYWYNVLNEKFYGRCDLVFNLVQLVGGSAAAAGAMAGSPSLVTGSGVALAICAAFSVTWKPGIKSDRHCTAKKAFLALKGQMRELEVAECARRCAEIQESESGMPALNMPAVVMTRRAMGDPYDTSSLSKWQRFISVLAY